MAVKAEKDTVLALLEQSEVSLSSPELLQKIDHSVPERTLRRWLSRWVDDGLLLRTGNRRSTRYQFVPPAQPSFKFLEGLTESRKISLIKQLRDLWTHSSTAVEGNTLTLGDTHFVLEEGLTISGKPVKDHQEVIGHAKAITLLYQNLNKSVTQDFIFQLHKAVQTDIVNDIYKPYGAWKIEPNGTYVVTGEGRQVYIEYALPRDVPGLMQEIITELNTANDGDIQLDNAHKIYAKLHAGIVHIHPFWDGNGRITRLLSNIPVLRAGLPPIIIPNEERKTYIQLLAEYQLATGQISKQTGVWPQPGKLAKFETFIRHCFKSTKQLVENAHS